MKKVLVLAVALLLMAALAAAQEPTQQEIEEYIKLARVNVRQERAQLVGEAMRLSAAQAAKFWPIYQEYETAFTLIGDKKLQLIKDYADVYDTMTDSAADALVERLFELNDEEQALILEYHGKVSSALGGAVAARFVQVEHRIGILLNLQLAAEIPLLEPPR